MFEYARLAYVALNVTDVARSADFYRRVVGLMDSGTGANGECFLRCSDDHHSLVLYPAQRPGLKRVGWELASERDLDLAREAFEKAELAITEIAPAESDELHQGPTYRCTEPYTGVTFELFSEMARLRGAPFVPTVAKIQRLGHVVVKTPQLEEATRFFVEKLNFRLSDRIRGLVSFMRCYPNPLHHSMALGKGAERQLHHLNFMVTEIDDVGRALSRLNREQVTIVNGPAGIPPLGSIFLYFLDPDGMTVEYSFGMEEFHEPGARQPETLDPVPSSFDYWESFSDPRKATVGEIEILGPIRGGPTTGVNAA